jgi:hypothetical protein
MTVVEFLFIIGRIKLCSDLFFVCSFHIQLMMPAWKIDHIYFIILRIQINRYCVTRSHYLWRYPWISFNKPNANSKAPFTYSFPHICMKLCWLMRCISGTHSEKFRVDYFPIQGSLSLWWIFDSKNRGCDTPVFPISIHWYLMNSPVRRD